MIRRHRGARLLHMVRSPYGRRIQGACTITIERGRRLALGAALSLAGFAPSTTGRFSGVHRGPRKPVVYQELRGQRVVIPTRYVIKAERQVAFEVAAYDATKPLIIDPVLAYSTYLGGSGGDQGFGIAADAVGNAYVTGFTGSTNFPTTAGAFGGGGVDAFVTKLSPTGALVYSTYLGGSGGDEGRGIAVDVAGNAYVTGSTGSTDFPTTAGAARAANRGVGGAVCAEHRPT